MDESGKASTMKMVITLKSGVQIKADVEEFTTGASPVFGELRNLKWTATEQPEVRITWGRLLGVVLVIGGVICIKFL